MEEILPHLINMGENLFHWVFFFMFRYRTLIHLRWQATNHLVSHAQAELSLILSHLYQPAEQHKQFCFVIFLPLGCAVICISKYGIVRISHCSLTEISLRKAPIPPQPPPPPSAMLPFFFLILFGSRCNFSDQNKLCWGRVENRKVGRPWNLLGGGAAWFSGLVLLKEVHGKPPTWTNQIVFQVQRVQLILCFSKTIALKPVVPNGLLAGWKANTDYCTVIFATYILENTLVFALASLAYTVLQYNRQLQTILNTSTGGPGDPGWSWPLKSS